MKRNYPFEIYLAGSDIDPMRLTLQETKARHFLLSYYATTPQQIDGIRKLKSQYPELNLFLDSGAFSAFMMKDTIDLDRYVAFIKETADLWNVITSLDIIGEMTGEETWKNTLRMETEGIKPMITYHMGEDFSVLERIASKYEFFALGGAASSELGKRATERWLDEVWRRVPNHRVHGFGIFKYEWLIRYPWASVDSTAWLNARRYGMIVHPEGNLVKAKEIGVDPTMPFTNTLLTVKNLLELKDRVNDAVDGSPILEDTLPGL